jgi:hypothetical protein
MRRFTVASAGNRPELSDTRTVNETVVPAANVPAGIAKEEELAVSTFEPGCVQIVGSVVSA